MDKDKIVTGHIYIFLFPNGKRYVGQTIRELKTRINQHWRPPKRERSFPVHNAMRYYGKENVNVEKTLTLKCTQEYLDLIEDRAIMVFNTLTPNGYNVKRGGSHGAHSEESKTKMSVDRRGRLGAMTGKHHSEQTKAKMSAARKGRVPSEEHKAKISAAKKGRPGSKGKPSPFLGMHHSEETKIRLSVINKGRVLSKEHKEKISAAKKGKSSGRRGWHHSEETKAKISATKKLRLAPALVGLVWRV